MNANRRKALAALEPEIDALIEKIDALRDEEQEYYDNMPEAMQGGDKGEKASAAVEQMEQAITDLENVKEYLQSAAE